MTINNRSKTQNYENLIKKIHYFRTNEEEYEKCFIYLDKYVSENSDIKNIQYYKCATQFFKLKAKNKTINEITEILTINFNQDIVIEVIEDLKNPQESFQYYDFPNCGDCKHCNFTQFCQYEDWKKITTKLIKQVNENMPSQEELLKSLSRVFV